MDPDLCIHSSLPSPLSSPLLPSLCWPLQCDPVPPDFVALLWSIKSFLKAPGLSHQQHRGRSDSLPLCRQLSSSVLPMFAVFLRLSLFLRICCSSWVTTATYTIAVTLLLRFWSAARIHVTALFTTVWFGRWHTLS